MTLPAVPDLTRDFAIEYDGPVLADHAIAVRELAPSLLALSQAFERANAIFNGNRATVTLEIRATQQGSFEVALTLRQVIEGASGFVTADFLASAADLVEILVGGSAIYVGLLGLVKRLRGEPPRIVVPDEPHPQTIQIATSDGVVTTSTRVMDLYQDGALRDDLEAIVRPLSRDGIDQLVVKQNNEAIETISKDDAYSFDRFGLLDAHEEQSVTDVIIPQQHLMPLSVSFKPGNKWRLTDGDKAHLYTVRDEQFNKEVSEGRKVGGNDVFVCEVRLRQYIGPNGDLKLEHEILRVIEQRDVRGLIPGQSRLPGT